VGLGSGQVKLLIFKEYHSKNKCFRALKYHFQGQNHIYKRITSSRTSYLIFFPIRHHVSGKHIGVRSSFLTIISSQMKNEDLTPHDLFIPGELTVGGTTDEVFSANGIVDPQEQVFQSLLRRTKQPAGVWYLPQLLNQGVLHAPPHVLRKRLFEIDCGCLEH